MENNSNTKNIHFPEVEKILDSSRRELLENAKRDAKYYGLKNRPPLNEPSCLQYVAPIKTQCEKIRADVLTIIQPDRYITAIQTLEANTKTKAAEITADIERLEHENDVDMRDLEGKTPPEKRKPNYLGIALTIAVNLADLVINALSFEFLGHGLFVSVFIGITVAGALFALATAIVRFMRRAATDGWKYYLAAAGCFAVTCGAFWVFSDFRTRMMTESGTEGLTPAVFFLLNIFFFVASIVIPIVFFPAKKDVDSDKQLAARFSIIEKRKEEIKQKKSQLEALVKTADEEKARHIAILSYTAHTMNRIASMYQEAVAYFKGQNLLSRQDRSVPVSFSEPLSDLSGIQFNLPPSLNLPSA